MDASFARGGLADALPSPVTVDGEDRVCSVDTGALPVVIQAATANTASPDRSGHTARGAQAGNLGGMASMLAHELNQPLCAIANHLHGARRLLSGDVADVATAREFLEAAEKQAQRAGDIIRGLRALTSRDTRGHAVERVAEVIDGVMPILMLNARVLDADLAVHIDAADQTRCDRVLLQQLVFNLLTNAMEAPPTHRRREVRLHGRPLGQGAYQISVEDNGPGVAPDTIGRLFGPLVSTKPGGMGLGLVLCRSIVEAHGGAITHGRGSLGGAAFTFTLNATGMDRP